MPADTRSALQRPRSVLIGLVMIALLGASLALAHSYSRNRQNNWRAPIFRRIVFDDLSIDAPADWTIRPGQDGGRPMWLLEAPDQAGHAIHLIPLQVLQPVTPQVMLKLQRKGLSKTSLLQGAAPDRAVVTKRYGGIVSARVTGSAGTTQQPHHYSLTTFTQDGRRYWLMLYRNDTSYSTRHLIDNWALALIDHMIASAEDQHYVQAVPTDLQRLELPEVLPENLTAYVQANTSDEPSVLITPTQGGAELIAFQITGISAAANASDADWSRLALADLFEQIHQRAPADSELRQHQVGDWTIWRIGAHSSGMGLADIIVEITPKRGWRIRQIFEPISLPRANDLLSNLLLAAQNSIGPTRETAPEPKDSSSS